MNKKRSKSSAILGAFIRKKREETGISLRELAERLGIIGTFMSEIELGKRNPPHSLIDGIAQELDLHVDDLLACNPTLAMSYFEDALREHPGFGSVFVQIARAVVNGNVSPHELQTFVKKTRVERLRAQASKSNGLHGKRKRNVPTARCRNMPHRPRLP